MGIADYMSAGLEANDNHIMYICMDMCHDKFASIQMGLIYRDKTNGCDRRKNKI